VRAKQVCAFDLCPCPLKHVVRVRKNAAREFDYDVVLSCELSNILNKFRIADQVGIAWLNYETFDRLSSVDSLLKFIPVGICSEGEILRKSKFSPRSGFGYITQFRFDMKPRKNFVGSRFRMVVYEPHNRHWELLLLGDPASCISNFPKPFLVLY